jgi:N-methylhydantoinase A
MSGFVCGVDIGGTFTDCVLVSDEGKVALGKALSSPTDSFRSGFFGSIEAAAARFGLTGDDVYHRMDKLISHGSTVATNIVVERKGARIGLITTAGFEDTIRIMRGMGRPTGESPENLFRVAETRKPEPLVAREDVFGVAERMDSLGDEIVMLDEAAVAAAAEELAARGVDAIAIAFLWSVRNNAHELRAREIAQRHAPKAFISVSSDISKAVGEYERVIATLINAYVGPVTSRYLHEIQSRLDQIGFAGELHIMQCHGGMVPISIGAERPVFTIGSGPVGGLIGCARVCDDIGSRDIIASDMGGTSFDIGIIKDGSPLAAADTLLGKFRYRIPALEVVSIGAGGGSIAWIDKHSGGLRVGPHSASSFPGPACYDRGGVEPTVTDADVVLGYIAPEATFGTPGDRGGFRPNRELAEKAIREYIAEPLGLSVADAALGIVEVANSKMANALENEIIGRGFDPRDFTLMSYGGAGPFHAVGYAQPLGIDTIVVPGEAASVWSAFGISQADIRYQYEAGAPMVQPFAPRDIQSVFESLESQAQAAMTQRDDSAEFVLRRFARMQFQWQLHELEIGVPNGELTDDVVAQVCRDFVKMYAERYGEVALLPGALLEIQSLRLEAAIPMGSASLDRLEVRQGEFRKGTRPVWFTRGQGPLETPIYDGDYLPVGEVIEGPAIIDLAITGIVLPPDTTCERRSTGDFFLKLNVSASSK